MRIIICGAGQVGTGIARQLTAEDHNIVIIDENADALREMSESLEVTTVLGRPSVPSVLEEAGAERSDLVIAVTLNDEINMVVCQVAHSLFNVPTKIARIRNQRYLLPVWRDLYRKNHLPIDYIISPELEVAHAILNRLHVPGALDMIPLAERSVRMLEIRCLKNTISTECAIHDLYHKADNLKFNIIAIERGEEVLIPSLDDSLYADDSAFVLVDQKDVADVMSFFSHEEKEASRVLLFGGGNIGTTLAQALEEEDSQVNVKLIEFSEERARKIAERLKKVTVIHGSSLDQQILEEVGVDHADTAIAVTNDDEVNIFSALLAKRYGCKRTIALVNKANTYGPLISTLGIDVVVNPRETTVSTILQHVRRGNVRAAYAIGEGRAELLEILVGEYSGLIGRTLADMEMPKDTMLGAIVREGAMLLPEAGTVIAQGDHLIIVSTIAQIKKVDRILSSRSDIF